MEFQNSMYVHRTADQVSVGYYCVGDKPLEMKKKKKKVFVRLDTRKLSSPCTEEIILAPISIDSFNQTLDNSFLR